MKLHMTSGSDALCAEASKLKQRSVGKTRSGPVDPNEVQCCGPGAIPALTDLHTYP